MHGGWSLRKRLVAGILVLLMMATLAIGVLSVYFVRANIVAQLDDELRIIAQRIENVAAPGRGPAQSFEGPGLPTGSLIGVIQSDGSTVAAYLDDNATVRELSSVQLRVLAIRALGEPVTLRLPGGLGEFRVLATSADRDTVLIVGLSTREVTTTVARLAAVIAAVLAGILIVAAVLGREVVRLGLRPLTRVREAATAVTTLPLDRGTVALADRLPALDTDPSTEVGQLGAAFTRMLEHVQNAFDARQASEQKVRQFVADASHELRTPLAAIRGYSELTRRSGHELPDDIRHALSRIESESVRMSALVDDLLLLARLDEGRELRRDPVDLSAIMTDAVADAQATSPAHDWVVRVPRAPVIVEGDQHRLHQVVANLLANARVHTPEGTRVTAALGTLEGRAIVTITDTGPGIPAEVQPVLFERFARADTSRSRATGSTGLGLSIVAAVVQAHGGEVAASSRPGETVFRVSLPLVRTPATTSA
ncbi:sensor histidine kinase [Microcella sp.]|uniref:sensor histidine kinase n=1 Tax=Microcella sp. TaxID=1913979 RepID=UPI00391D92D4